MKESQLENKTSIATNDYVRMVDENGNSVKIKKDSFMAAIRDALPSIISDGSTGAGSVLSVINGTLKTRTDANLASVLGADKQLLLRGGKVPVFHLGGFNPSSYLQYEDRVVCTRLIKPQKRTFTVELENITNAATIIVSEWTQDVSHITQQNLNYQDGGVSFNLSSNSTFFMLTAVGVYPTNELQNVIFDLI